MVKIREETNERASLEVKLKVQIELNEKMSDIIVRQGQLSSQEAGRRKESRSPGRSSPVRRDSRSEILCRNHAESGECKRKNCAFFHPSGRSRSPAQPSGYNKPDCSFWMAGHCKKPEDKCFGKHEPIKCGSQAKRKPTVKMSYMSNMDFADTLAKAVSQGMAGVQQQTAQAPAIGQQGGVFPALNQ